MSRCRVPQEPLLRFSLIRQGFTLVELMIVMAILMVLSSFLFPAFAKARRQSGNAVCLSNLKGQYGALAMYLDDSDNYFPPIHLAWEAQGAAKSMEPEAYEASERSHPQNYATLFQPYLKTREVFRCPLDIGLATAQDRRTGGREETCFERFGTSYRPAAELGSLLGDNLADIKDTAGLYWAADGSGYWHTRYSRSPDAEVVDNTGYKNDMNRWQSNAVFLDGHARISFFIKEVWDPYVQFINESL